MSDKRSEDEATSRAAGIVAARRVVRRERRDAAHIVDGHAHTAEYQIEPLAYWVALRDAWAACEALLDARLTEP